MVGIEMLSGTIGEDMLVRLAGAEQEAARGTVAFGGDDAGRSEREPDGLGGVPAARGGTAGHALSVDQPAFGQRLDRVDAVMAPYGRDVLGAGRGRRATDCPDHGPDPVDGRHQAVMVAVRIAGRALPLSWRIKETQGRSALASSARHWRRSWRCCPPAPSLC